MDIRKLINKTKLHREIIAFFYENPFCIDTPRGVSTWVKHDRTKVKKILDEFSSFGILIAHKATSTTGYSLTRDKAIISKIKKLLTS